MRWLHMAIVILFAAAITTFALQNLQAVGVSFIRASIEMPLALLIAGVYFLGAVTGGSLFALLRRSYAKARHSALGT
jgi:lipopolysaccharide assembly protein A